MAIKNAIIQGSYTTVIVDYAKENRRISIQATVYQDSSKTQIISQVPITYQGIKIIDAEVSTIVTSENEIPLSPQINDSIFTPSQIEVVFSVNELPIYDKDGNVVRNPDGSIKTEFLKQKTKAIGILSYNGSGWNSFPVQTVKANGKYFKYSVLGYIEYNGHDTIEWWDEQFSIEKMKDYDDIYAFVYSWLMKNNPIFIGAEVC